MSDNERAPLPTATALLAKAPGYLPEGVEIGDIDPALIVIANIPGRDLLSVIENGSSRTDANHLYAERSRRSRGAWLLAAFPGIILGAGLPLAGFWGITQTSIDLPAPVTIHGKAPQTLIQGSGAIDPYSPNYSIPRGTLAADRIAAQGIIAFAIQHHDKITSVTVTGMSSNSGDKLGTTGPRGEHLALLREAAGVTAVEQVADFDHVALPVSEIHYGNPVEDKLTVPEISQVDSQAAALHETPEALINSYNHNDSLPTKAKALLNNLFGKNQSIEISATMQGKETTSRQGFINKLTKVQVNWPTVDLIAGMAGLVFGEVSAMGLSNRAANFLSSGRARRKLGRQLRRQQS
jgi:hypothetical protein